VLLRTTWVTAVLYCTTPGVSVRLAGPGRRTTAWVKPIWSEPLRRKICQSMSP
jgi:hypothetical protein